MQSGKETTWLELAVTLRPHFFAPNQKLSLGTICVKFSLGIKLTEL